MVVTKLASGIYRYLVSAKVYEMRKEAFYGCKVNHPWQTNHVGENGCLVEDPERDAALVEAAQNQITAAMIQDYLVKYAGVQSLPEI